jgi:phage baseplate assembly protein gpV
VIELNLGKALLTVRDENGFLGVQRDPLALKAQAGESPPYELLHTYGFASRPLDPTGTKGCSLFFGLDGHEGFAWLANDPRVVDKIPPLAKGGSVQYASDGSFAAFDPDTHTWSLYVPYAQGKAHSITAGLDGNNKPLLEVVHGDGMAVTMLEKSLVLRNAAGDAYIEINDSGIVINGNVKVNGALEANGAKITPAGDVQTATGVSLALHTHLSAMGPTAPPTPTPTP